MLREWILCRAQRIAAGRAPDFVIGGADNPYLQRWWLIPRNKWFNVYLHHFMRSDDDRALHDHPWINVSYLIDGYYWEHTPEGEPPYLREPGHFYARSAAALHRVELPRDDAGREVPAWTLFITGPRVRDWGFACPKGWVPWQQFTSSRDKGQIGRGCD
jgi:hypothetical protein